MSTACFIPIKANSERIPGKNLCLLNGRKLYEYVCGNVKKADIFDAVFIDTNSEEIKQYAQKMNFQVIERKKELALNTANGNDLLVYHQKLYSEFDYYFQIFATAPYLQPKTICNCVSRLTSSADYDSVFTVTANHGFYWYANMPVNYRPEILPRSQDMIPVMEESTGLYGIEGKALARYQCRIGAKPYMYQISRYEAVDINTEEDLKIAEHIGKVVYHL